MSLPMTIRCLNCASMTPWWPRWQLGGTCLLVKRDQGWVLVDTGLGLHDHESPSPLVKFYRLDFGIRYAPEECAVSQLARAGLQPDAIHDIVLTHLHFDHAGGLPDFPAASVHLHRREYEAVRHPTTWLERFAYDRRDVAHGPAWVLYEEITGQWFGFDAIRLPFSPRMFLIPLFGHTSGHCGVAIETEDGWFFQVGDALPLSADFDLTPGWLNRLVLGAHCERLRAFSISHPEVRLLAGHAWQTDYQTNEVLSSPPAKS